MKLFLMILMSVLLGGAAKAGDSLIPKGFNFSPDEVLHSFCPSTVALITEMAPLKDDGPFVEKFKKQIREMADSGELTGQELQRAKITTVVGQVNNTSIHLIQVSGGAQEKYFYIIPSAKDRKSPWGMLGTPQALKDLGSVIILSNGHTIIQSSTRYAIINNAQTSENIQRYYVQYRTNVFETKYPYKFSSEPPVYSPEELANVTWDKYHHRNIAYDLQKRFLIGKGTIDENWKARPLYPMPDEVRQAFSENQPYAAELQYLVDIGILTLKRLETAKFYEVTSLKTKENFNILEFDSNGDGSKKLRIYFMDLRKKFLVRKTDVIEFGLLNSPEGITKLGDRLQLKDGQVMRNDPPSPQGGQALLSELTGEDPDSQILIPQIFESENNSQQDFIAGPTDLEAYKIERAAIAELKPEIDLESLASIHQYGTALEESVSSLSHKKMALQKIIFDESYWKIDGEKVSRLLKKMTQGKPPTRLEVVEQIVPVLKARRGDLTKYLGYLSEIKSTTQVTQEKLKEFSLALQGMKSFNFPLDTAQVQNELNQYSAVLEGNLNGLNGELNGVVQTIAYFKQVSLMLAAGSNQEIDSQLATDLKLLHKIFSDLSGKNMNGLLIATQGGSGQ